MKSPVNKPANLSADSVNSRFAAAALCERHWFACNQVETLGKGRINDTYRINRVSDNVPFVLQRLNTTVFTQGEELMRQTERVVAHLQTQHPGWVPDLVPGLGGKRFFTTNDNVGTTQVWRVWSFVDHARIRERLTSAVQLRNVGAAFGYTHALLEDLPGPQLQDPLPGLFDLAGHYDQLDQLLGTLSLSPETRQCVQSARQLQHLASGFGERNQIIHGDCKSQNLLFRDRGDEVACVLDLDTVMWGNWAWDFGDLVRSAALDDQGFSLSRFKPLLRGFIQTSPRNHNGEAELFASAPAYIACGLGLRYLIDHLLGDVQFKVQRHGDNLRRASARLALAAQLDEARGDMTAEAALALKH